MATALMLFNLNLAPLFDAVAQVESNNGKTSDNVYQLSDIFIDDVNNICGKQVFLHADKFDRERSEQMMVIYWSHYGQRYQDWTGNAPTYAVLARIHNGGPNGARMYATKRYAKKVMSIIEENK